MKDHFIGSVCAYKGDNEAYSATVVPLEVTDMEADGATEISFKDPRGIQHYVRFNLGEFVAKAALVGRPA